MSVGVGVGMSRDRHNAGLATRVIFVLRSTVVNPCTVARTVVCEANAPLSVKARLATLAAKQVWS